MAVHKDRCRIGAFPRARRRMAHVLSRVINTCNGFRYSMGAAILDLNDPSKVICRSRGVLRACRCRGMAFLPLALGVMVSLGAEIRTTAESNAPQRAYIRSTPGQYR